MEKMKDIQASIYYTAKENIDLAQLRYKRDYDRKHCKKKCA